MLRNPKIDLNNEHNKSSNYSSSLMTLGDKLRCLDVEYRHLASPGNILNYPTFYDEIILQSVWKK